MIDPARLREDFPILRRQVRGKRLVYLDNAATSQKPRPVIEALNHFYSSYNSNVHRGIHTLSQEATEAYEEARRKVARFINAAASESVIFTRNATEAVNLVAHGWGRKYIQEGDEILLTEMEHHSNLVPWILLAQEKRAVLRHLPITDDGRLPLEQLERFMTPRTRLVSVSAMSNVLGTINPVAEIARKAHQVGAVAVVDAAQAAPHVPLDVRGIDCDFLALSAHKMLGPTGVGVLYGKKNLLEEMNPFLGGGDMIREVYLDRATWNELPYKFEAGTPNVGGVIAFGAAIDYLSRLGMDAVRAHERGIAGYALERLGQLSGTTIYGPRDPGARGAVVAFNHRDIHAHDLGQILDDEGVAIRAGHHCCQPLMRRLGVSATARASFYIYNTEEDVEALVAALVRAEKVFGYVSG